MATGVLVAAQRKAVQLTNWTDPKESAAAFGVGLFWFFLVGWLQYSSVTVLSYTFLFHLLARFAYRNGCRILADLNLLAPRPVPSAPPSFVTEDEVLQHLSTATELANSAFHAAYTLAVCDASPVVFKWMGGIFCLAIASKIFGTTGLFFVSFVGVFTWPKLYTEKKLQIDAATFLVWTRLSDMTTHLGTQLSEHAKKLPSIPKASDLKKKETNVKPKSL